MNVVKMYGLLIIAYKLLDRCCNYISSDNLLNQQKIKAITNNLISNIRPVIHKFDNLVESEIEDIDAHKDQVQTKLDCMELMNDVFQDNPLKIFDLHTILVNFKENKRLYTQTEYDNRV